MMERRRPNEILDLSFETSLMVIGFSEKIRAMNRFDMASQIFKCGTSIGANIHEAQSAESRADFVHKIKIAAKETDELEFWLKLCQASPFFPNPDERLLTNLLAIKRIISKIVATSKARRN